MALRPKIWAQSLSFDFIISSRYFIVLERKVVVCLCSNICICVKNNIEQNLGVHQIMLQPFVWLGLVWFCFVLVSIEIDGVSDISNPLFHFQRKSFKSFVFTQLKCHLLIYTLYTLHIIRTPLHYTLCEPMIEICCWQR